MNFLQEHTSAGVPLDRVSNMVGIVSAYGNQEADAHHSCANVGMVLWLNLTCFSITDSTKEHSEYNNEGTQYEMSPVVELVVDIAHSSTLNENKTKDTPSHPGSPAVSQPEVTLKTDHVGTFYSSSL